MTGMMGHWELGSGAGNPGSRDGDPSSLFGCLARWAVDIAVVAALAAALARWTGTTPTEL